MALTIVVSPYGVAEDSLPTGTHFFGDHVRFGPLDDQARLQIVDYLDKLGEELLSKRVRQRPAFVVAVEPIAFLKGVPSDLDRLDLALHLHRFCLEYFAATHTPMAAFAFNGAEISARTLDYRELLSVEAHPLEAGVWEKFSAYLGFAYANLSDAPLARLAISRICRAYRHNATPDGVIDLAVGLECLIPADTEISYQFSLFHSLINQDDAADRKVIFDLLRSLYSVRSQIVHGGVGSKSDKKKLKDLVENWDKILDVARSNLTYYIMYCSRHGAETWGDHLRLLALGSARLSTEAA